MLDVSWDGRRLLTFIEPLIKVDVAGMSNEKLGAIRLELYLDGLFAPSFEQSAEAEDYQLALFDDQGECLYTSQSSVPDILADWTPAPDCSDMEMHSLNSYTLIQRPLAEYGLTLVYLFDNNEKTLQKQALKRMIYPLVLALVAVIAACAMIYFRSFSAARQQAGAQVPHCGDGRSDAQTALSAARMRSQCWIRSSTRCSAR